MPSSYPFTAGPVPTYPPPGAPQPAPPALAQQPTPPPTKRVGRARRVVGLLMVVLGVCPALAGVGVIVKAYSNHRIQIKNDAFMAVAWHNLRTDEIFPNQVDLADGGAPWTRQGIAEETSCDKAFRADFAKLLAARTTCTTALRATYVDVGGATAATIGVAVVGTYQEARDVTSGEFAAQERPGPLVFPVAVKNTPAARWSKELAWAGGAVPVGLDVGPTPPHYVAAITVGPTDPRDYGALPDQWAPSARGERLAYVDLARALIPAYSAHLYEVMS
ncbi:hypothetical protein ACIBTV_19755 [Micromonospora sp. NPDC049366]|uniref:hypothetical protein n=1 Tax=Micromonospora sp. NPDC049366 TaxID=3364271 RepID=UPI0037875D0B